MFLEPGTRLGVYEVVALVGAGGMGEVYRARDGRLQRDVAIKVLPAALSADPDRRARLETEARVLAALNHPHIAAVYGLEESDGVLGIVLELVEGETLADRIARGAVPVSDARALTEQLIDALEAAHDRGIVHRDLKPANIRIAPGGVLKVLDFGLARATAPDQAVTAKVTAAGAVLGTPAYMSPEQARGQTVDKRTDIWAFGCVLFEMLVGTAAFAGDSGADVVSAVLTRTPDWTLLPGDAPSSLRRLLRHCLEKDPLRRLRDIGDARLELNAAAEDSSAGAGGAPPPAANRWSSWLAAAAVGALIAGAAVWLVRRSDARPAADSIAFQIDPPDGSSWTRLPAVPNPVVSPDGAHIAFGGQTPAGRRLYVRDLRAVAAREIPGTQDATVPFWSPDGRKIGYCVAGRIKKIDLGGRPPEDIAAPCVNDGDWRAGEIVFGGRDGVFVVPEAGGAARRLTSVSAPREAAHMFPRWLPDASHVLFLVKSSDAQARGLYVVPAGGGAPQRILPDETMGIPIRDDAGRLQIVFVRGATLVAQRLDASTFRPIDEPIVLAGPIAIGLTVPRGAYSASASTLAYRIDASFAPTRLQWFDRTGRPLETIDNGNAFVLGLALSPDQSTVAFGRYSRETNNFSMWLADRRGTTRLMTAPPYSVEPGVWSPDGRAIAAVSNESRTYLPAMVSPAGQVSPLPLTLANAQNVRVTDWSPDGKWILAVDERVVWAVPADGAAPQTRVTAGQFARFSPDGKWLAFSSSETGGDEVYVAPFPGAATKTRVSTAGGYEPRWRGDGRELFYLDGAGDLTSVPIRTEPSLEIGAPARLFRSQMRPDIDATYVATKDGQRFLLNLPNQTLVPLNVVVNWLEGRGSR